MVRLWIVPVAWTLASASAFAQVSDQTTSLRTPDGQPDTSGIFTFRALTPLERPEELAGVETLGAEDATAWEAAERTRRNRDLFDPEKGALFYRPRAEGGVLSYKEFWYEHGIEMTADKRTSLIIVPPNGRRSAGQETATGRSRAQAAYRPEHRYDSYENRSAADRCLMGFNAGPPMVSGTYNNNVMIFQSTAASPVGIEREKRWSSRPRTFAGEAAGSHRPTCTASNV